MSTVSKSVQRLTARLASIRSGPSSRPLPLVIKGLRVRYHDLKGNAGAKHWATEALPGIRFANPNVEVVVVPTTRRRTLAKGKATETDEGDDAEVVPVVEVESAVKEPWKLPPGVFISFHDDRPQAFFPLTSARSEKLVKRFWDTVGSPEALAKLSTTGEDVTVEDVQEVVEEAVEAAVEAVEAVLEGQEKVVEGTTTTSS